MRLKSLLSRSSLPTPLILHIQEYKFRYTGAVTLKDVKDAGDPPAQDYTEVDLGNELTQGYFEFDGDIYKTGGVSNNWLIYLADSRVDFTKQKLVGPGKILMLELNTAPSDGKVLPAGTFNVLRSCFELFEMFFEVKNLHFLPASSVR